jgi:hypothetical protein
MNFYNNDEKDGGAPVIPGAASPFRKKSAFGKAPIFSRAAGSIMDRFKNLSRKDMAFVGIGLSVLVMAPVAEYMMSKPAESTLLSGGFGDRRGDPSSLHELGYGALSAGSADGSGEVITPLSARDPASLILGSQPATPVMPPAAAAPPSSSWRDAVKDAGREAFTAASKSAGAPTVIPKMQSAFRSLFSGGSSGTTGSRGGANSAIIADAKSASSKAAKRSMVGPVAMAGYKGVASSTPNSSSKGAFEKLRAQADKSAGNFSGGSAMNSLDKAAADAVQLGAGSGGSGGLGDGDSTKKNSPNSVKGYDRNINPKESLAEMAAKQRMQKALEWEFFKKYEIPKQIINAVVGEVSKWLGGQVASALKGPGPAPGAPTYCFPYENGSSGACRATPLYNIALCDKEKGMNCDLSKCCRVGKEGTGTTPPGGNPPPAGGDGNPPPAGGDGTPPPAGGDGHANPGDGTAGASNPAVNAVFGEYDTTLKAMLQEIQKGAGATDAKELLKSNIALTGGFANLKANDVATRVKGAATNALSKEIATYESSVVAARRDYLRDSGEFNVFKEKFDKVKAASDNETLVTKPKEGHSAVASADVKRFIEASQKDMDEYDSSVKKLGELLAFNERSVTIYKSQAGKASGMAEKVSQDYTGKVLAKSNQLQGEMQSLQTQIDGGTALLPDKVERIKAVFQELSGSDSQVTVPAVTPTAGPDTAVAGLPPADLRTAVADSGEALIGSPLKWRGVPADISNAMSGSTLNDADSLKKEGDAWKETTPKNKGDVANLKDLNNLAEDSLLASGLRANKEIPEDAGASMYDPKSIADAMAKVLTDMRKIRDTLTNPDIYNIDLDNPTGSGAGGENPGGTPGAGNGNGVTNAATARADSVLSDGTQRMALNQPVLDGIVARSNNCTSTECKERLANARTAMGDMTTKIGEIQELQRQAMQPGANVPEIDAAIQQKQRELHGADQRFDEAARRVAALEGYTPPRPPAQPTADQVAKQEDINKAEFHVRAIDACYVGTSGFKPNASGLCERELATRTATTVLTARGWRGDVVGSNDAAHRTTLLGYLSNERGTAYGWASRCLRTMPAGCTR